MRWKEGVEPETNWAQIFMLQRKELNSLSKLKLRGQPLWREYRITLPINSAKFNLLESLQYVTI